MAKPIQDYKSRHNDAASKRFGTFSYLPKMNASSIRRQVQYMIDRGWNCAVEHVEPEMASSDYWYMWKLPLFGERDLDAIMAELTACRNENPHDLVRIIGYDNKRQTQGQSFVVHRGST
jgi:ribulose-bisphosphate carboxylase small chain